VIEREEIERRVDALAAEHEGKALAEAVRRYADELDAVDRKVLGKVLLARAGEQGAFDYALGRRIGEKRWRLFPPRPKEPGR
jgi:hypothetical protein